MDVVHIFFNQFPMLFFYFQKPVPPKNFKGVFQAGEMPPSCVPLHLLASFDYSEDCLFLNVFRPSSEVDVDQLICDWSSDFIFQFQAGTQQNSTKRLPVLVFIHGGGFNVGGLFVEGYRNLSNNFVSRGIVVVTLQYRLGILGGLFEELNEMSNLSSFRLLLRRKQGIAGQSGTVGSAPGPLVDQ
jgi:carboxylesterase type B